MTDVILGAVISAVSASMGIILQIIATYLFDKKKQRMEALAVVYDKKLSAYEEIYESLSKCKRLYRNMLRYPIQECKRDWFYCTMPIIEEAYDIYEKNEIYYQKDISDLLDLKLQVAIIKNERINDSSSMQYLVELSDENFKWIQEVLEKIRADIHVDEIQ